MKISALFLIAAAASAADQARPSPEAAYNQAVRTADRSDGRGEQFCWNANYSLGQFLRAYQAWHDTAWLDWGVKYYDHLVGEMQTGPDGYKGWIGPYMYDRSVWQDSHVGDAILAAGMLDFAETVLRDPALKARYGDAARRYVTVARRDVLEKWDRRGSLRYDGPYAAYVTWDQFAEPGNRGWRVRKEVTRAGMSHPFNKQNDMALVALRLYRITGEKPYRDLAEKIFARMRSRFHLLRNHWIWNYWEPFGFWDLDLAKGAPVHWVGVHPYRNYQAREVEQIVEAYHTGIVFSRQDLERIIRTNLEVMWNGDRAHPQFVNSDNDYPGGAEKRARLKPPEGEGLAGTLWTALVPFSETIRDLWSPRNEMARAWFENVVRKTPVSWTRRYAPEPAALPSFPDGESKDLTYVAALPAHFETRAGTWLASNSIQPGTLEIALYSPDGARKLKTLHRAEVPRGNGNVIWHWQDEKPGPYRIRWTINDGYRELGVFVR